MIRFFQYVLILSIIIGCKSLTVLPSKKPIESIKVKRLIENFEKSEEKQDYIYEPSAEDIYNAVIPRHVEYQVWHALLESAAAEHAARMTSMENASKNATTLIEELTLRMNKVRQATITREILEIVSGAEAIQ